MNHRGFGSRWCLHVSLRGFIELGSLQLLVHALPDRFLGKQMGTLGAGNHYAEVQIVEKVFDQKNADALGIGKVGQVCIMIHSGSRGLGHQVRLVC